MPDSHAYFRLQSLLLSTDVYRVLNEKQGQLFELLPELKGMVGYRQANPYHSRDLWDHTIFSVAQVPADLVLRLTMLLHDAGKLCTRSTDANGIDHFYGHPQESVRIAGPILSRLGISEMDCLMILRLIAWHDETLPTSADELRAMADRFGTGFMVKLIQVKQADALAQNPEKLADRIQQLEELRRLLTI